MLLLLTTGCARIPHHSPLTTHPQAATTQYWLDQPPSVTLEHHQYDRLWQATERTVRAYFFTLDRADYRRGLLSSRPMISRQFFEIWRRDTATPSDLLQSSLGTVRRTLHFQIERIDDDDTSSITSDDSPLTPHHSPTYVLTPRVIVERLARTEQRYTTAIQYGGAFLAEPSPDAEPGDVPIQYWYAIGRDEALEQRLIWSIERRLR